MVLASMLLLCISSCCKDKSLEPSEVLGAVTVDLDAEKQRLRTREALIGNLVCDGIESELRKRGEKFDLVLMNSGGIRFNPETRPSGIYPKGNFTASMVEEMLPFGNSNVIVKVSGKELRSIFERSVALLPSAGGGFLQVSSGVRILVDTLQPAQAINDLAEPPQIISEGRRILSIKINAQEFDSLATYLVVVPDFLALQNPNDGFVAFRNIPAGNKLDLGDDQAETVKEFIRQNAPVTPRIEGRIVFK